MNFLKIATALFVSYLIYRLVPFLFLLFFAVLISATLSPVVDWLNQKKLPHWFSKTIVCATLIAGVVFTAMFLVPELVRQVSSIVTQVPKLQTDLQNSVSSEFLRNKLLEFFKNPTQVVDDAPKKIALLGTMFLGTAYDFMILIILSIYLLLDGSQSYSWIIAYFSEETSEKLRETIRGIRPVIFAYIGGQALTSVIIGIFIFATHHFLKVPGALMLGALAAVCDIVPVLGFLISISVATLLALTVSAKTALIVIVLHVAYMLFENNVLIPKIYGANLRISSLTVLVSILAANTVAGIAGMVMILPIVASYPIIERIWLRRAIGDVTVDKHQKQIEG